MAAKTSLPASHRPRSDRHSSRSGSISAQAASPGRFDHRPADRQAALLSQERTWRRKIPEMLLASSSTPSSPGRDPESISTDLPPDTTAGCAGDRRASQLYLGKDASQLRLDEAALLAGMIRARIATHRRNGRTSSAPAATPSSASWSSMAGSTTLSTAGHGPRRQLRGMVPFLRRRILYLRAPLRDRESGRPASRAEGGLTIVNEMDQAAQRAAERTARAAAATHYDWIAAEARNEPLQRSSTPRDSGIHALVGGSGTTSPVRRTQAMRRQPISIQTLRLASRHRVERFPPTTRSCSTPINITVSNSES